MAEPTRPSATALMQRTGAGRPAPGLTLARVGGGAALCGIGFTISLFIVGLAVDGDLLQAQTRVGILAASVLAFLLGWAWFRLVDRFQPAATVGRFLVRDFDPEHDHYRGNPQAPLQLVEYGDFECPFCSRATGSIDDVLEHFGPRLVYVWRLRYAPELGLDVDRLRSDLLSGDVINRVNDDALDAEFMGLYSTPTFFIGSVRHFGPYDAPSLIRALEEAARKASAGRRTARVRRTPAAMSPCPAQ